jgi:hypothetical protein
MAIELRQEFSNDSNMFSIHQILAIQEVPGNLQIGRFFFILPCQKNHFPGQFQECEIPTAMVNFHELS